MDLPDRALADGNDNHRVAQRRAGLRQLASAWTDPSAAYAIVFSVTADYVRVLRTKLHAGDLGL
jgi:hypothetical protein